VTQALTSLARMTLQGKLRQVGPVALVSVNTSKP